MLRLLVNAEHGASSGALVLQTAPMHPWLNMAVYMLAYLLFDCDSAFENFGAFLHTSTKLQIISPSFYHSP